MQSPVIVIGMGHSGTTLVSEMLHKADTPMYSGDMNADYDNGIRYERPLTKQINTQVFGLEKKPKILEQLWTLPLHPLTQEQLDSLQAEVGDGPWGFKDPRTAISYPVWAQAFPHCINLSVYRRHEEVMRSFYRDRKSRISALRRMRRGLIAWVHYNEKVLEYLESDRQAGRACVLVKYEELMEHACLLKQVETALNIRLFDARNLNLRRNRVKSAGEKLLYRLGSIGYESQIARLYQELDANRIKPDCK